MLSNRRKSSRLFAALDKRLSISKKSLSLDEGSEELRVAERCSMLEKKLSDYCKFHDTIDTRLNCLIDCFRQKFDPEDLEILPMDDRGSFTIKIIEHIMWLVKLLLEDKKPKNSVSKCTEKEFRIVQTTQKAIVIQSPSDKDSDESANLSPIAEINSETEHEELDVETSFKNSVTNTYTKKITEKSFSDNVSNVSSIVETENHEITSKPDSTNYLTDSKHLTLLTNTSCSILMNIRPFSNTSSVFSEDRSVMGIENAQLSAESASLRSVSSSESIDCLTRSKWTFFFPGQRKNPNDSVLNMDAMLFRLICKELDILKSNYCDIRTLLVRMHLVKNGKQNAIAEYLGRYCEGRDFPKFADDNMYLEASMDLLRLASITGHALQTWCLEENNKERCTVQKLHQILIKHRCSIKLHQNDKIRYASNVAFCQCSLIANVISRIYKI